MKTRCFEISLLNVLLCLSVIFIHVTSAALAPMDKSTWQYAAVLVPWRLAAFVVPGFIFLSGIKLFINSKKGFSYAEFLKKRLSAVVLPYILWVLVYYLYFCLRNYFPFQVTELLKYIFFGNLVAHFYFVVVIVQFYLLAPLWLRLFKKSDGRWIVLFSFILLFVLANAPAYSFHYRDRLFTTYIFYWALGCYAGMNYEKFKELLTRKRLMLIPSILFAVTAALNAFLSWLNFSGRRQIFWLENVHIFYCVSAVLFCFMVSIFWERRKTGKLFSRFVNAVDRASYLIYLSHCLVIFVMDAALQKAAFEAPMGINYLLRLSIVYSVTILGCVIWKDIVRKKIILRTVTW